MTGCGADPNLYNCGKVCLSLLGTWEGEGWTPDKSTLTQVLVSIQGYVPWWLLTLVHRRRLRTSASPIAVGVTVALQVNIRQVPILQ